MLAFIYKKGTLPKKNWAVSLSFSVLLDKISCWRSANHWYYWVLSDPIITLRPKQINMICFFYAQTGSAHTRKAHLMHNGVKRFSASHDGRLLSQEVIQSKTAFAACAELPFCTAALLFYCWRLPKYTVNTIEVTARRALNNSTFVMNFTSLSALIQRKQSGCHASPLDQGV